jgi:cytochrome c peroxidase
MGSTGRTLVNAIVVGLCAALSCGLSLAQPREPRETFTSDEIALIKTLGPWPSQRQRDPSNALSGNPIAIELGERLFLSPKLSGSGALSCVSCHRPAQGFSDGLAVSVGAKVLSRNSQTLWNLAGQRWFAWDGASDSLWSHSLKPLFHPDEMAATPEHINRVLRNDPRFASLLKKLPQHQTDQHQAATVGKALAAFLETLQSPITRFDRFRDQLGSASNPTSAEREQSAEIFSPAAQRGLKLFIGKGACIACHSGANFTNGEFADNGVGHFKADKTVDPGRHGGLAKLLKDPMNLLGPMSDVKPNDQTHTQFVAANHNLFGQFKVPSLRELTRSGPYMHDGRIKTLREVLEHYSNVSPDRLHSDGEKSLRAAQFTNGEINDLLAFLESLSSVQPPKNALDRR